MLINPYRQARFTSSAHRLDQLVADRGMEVAFVGRSNAGKSSVINTLTGHNNLARTSRTPGRTQLINFFTLVGGARLVDLPGYGFARVPEKQRRHWDRTLGDYFLQRASLQGVVLIVDIRRLLSPLDVLMLELCDSRSRPVHILLNKSDKLNRDARGRALSQVQRETAAPGHSAQLFSCLKSEGLDELVRRLNDWLPEKKEGPG